MIRPTLPALGLTMVIASGASAQTAPAKWADTISAEIENAQLAGDTAKLAAAAALASRVAVAYPNDGLILHYKGYALYREALFASRNRDATPLFQEAFDVLSKSLAAHPLAESHMLLSAIDGQLIAKSPSRAMELGMQSQSSTGSALRLGPSNPRVWLLRGQGAIFTPPEYGGGLDVAEEFLKKSIELFASDAPKPGEPSWGKAEAYVWLGQVYERKGDKAQAAQMYDKALEVSPKYGYAKALSAALK